MQLLLLLLLRLLQWSELSRAAHEREQGRKRGVKAQVLQLLLLLPS
jgi:hypothetical protein